MFIRAVTTALSIATIGMATTLSAETTKVPFALDWKFEGPAAPYFLAIDKGYFADAGLDVEVTAGQGSLDAIPKVATGAFPIGFADINSLVKFIDQNPGAPVIAVMMTYDKPPFAVVGRKSLGIEEPKDLEGKILGAPPPDGAWAQFSPFAAAAGIDKETVTVEPVGFPTREPMLAEGKVDAVTGYNFSSYLNLARLGVPEDDISIILMADHGLELYGNALIVNTDFAEENPELVKGFVAAVGKGWADAIADPEAGAAAVIQRNPAGDHALETRRLQLCVDANVVTDFTKEHGMGKIDPERFERSLLQLAQTYDFKNTPDATLYYTDAYLPEGGISLQ